MRRRARQVDPTSPRESGLLATFPLSLLPRVDDVSKQYGDWWNQRFALRMACVNAPYNLHSANDFTEGGESLSVRVTASTKIELRLVSNANEEFRRSIIGPPSRHGYRAVAVSQSSISRALQGYRSECVRILLWIGICLNHGDWHSCAQLIVWSDCTSKASTVCNVLKEIAGGTWSALQVNRNLNGPKSSLK
jgi:hypothetical protein